MILTGLYSSFALVCLNIYHAYVRHITWASSKFPQLIIKGLERSYLFSQQAVVKSESVIPVTLPSPHFLKLSLDPMKVIYCFFISVFPCFYKILESHIMSAKVIELDLTATS